MMVESDTKKFNAATTTCPTTENDGECKAIAGCRWNSGQQPKCKACSIETKVAKLDHSDCETLQQCEGSGTNAQVGGENNDQCVCKAGFKLNVSTCERCEDGKISAAGDNVCKDCDTQKEVSNNDRTVCLCKDGWGVSTTGQTECTQCQPGTFHTTDKAKDTVKSVCSPCEAGSISETSGQSNCTTCKADTPVSNLTRTKCVTETNCGDNAEAQNNQCVCKNGFTLKDGKCEGGNTPSPSTASAAAIAAIVIALLAVVAAAATAAVVAVRARKARAAEAEALTAENM